MVRVGIIGGTGVYQDTSFLKDFKEIPIVDKPYGEPSVSKVISGKISNTEVFLLARHGDKHTVNPSNVNYRANIYTLKSFKCDIIITTTACGSLKIENEPGTLAIIDQYIDRTKGIRKDSFYNVCHIPQGEPFDKVLNSFLSKSIEELGYKYSNNVTAVTIEGPRFSTKAESNLYRSWGADIVNMTSVPEVVLAAELGIIYASLALISDYDCWHTDPEETVNVDLVTQRLPELKKKAHNVILKTIEKIEKYDWNTKIKETNNLANLSVMHK